MRSGRPILYEVRRQDGVVVETLLMPEFRQTPEDRRELLMCFGLLSVAVLYILVAGVVWWNKPDEAPTWALMLFSSAMAVLLASSVRAGLTPWWSWRSIANLPWVGATAFHLFTIYPTVPRWIRKIPEHFIKRLSVGADSFSGGVALGDSGRLF